MARNVNVPQPAPAEPGMENDQQPQPETDLHLSPEVVEILRLQGEMDKKREAALAAISTEIARLQEVAAKIGGSVGGVIPTGSKYNPAKYCTVCNIPGHDGRAHRGQPSPRKYSHDELQAAGLLPPTPERM